MSDEVTLERRLAAAERQLAELRELLDRSPAGVARLEGPDLVCTAASAEHQRLTGGLVAIGASARAALERPGAPPILPLVDHVLATGEPASAEALAVPGPDGRDRYIAVRVTPVGAGDGASSSAVAVFVVDATQEARGRARMSSLLAVATAFSEAVTTDDVARVVAERIHDEAQAAATVLYVLGADDEPPRLAASRGLPEVTIAAYRELPRGAQVPLADALRTREAVFIETRDELLARYPPVARSPVAPGALHAVAALPIQIGPRLLGGIAMSFAQARHFDAPKREFLLSVAGECALALERARALREAQEANRLRDEFLGVVSHELRTPLNAILGWVTLLRGKKADDEASLARGLDTIERNARAQARLVDDVLDVSRIISGKLLVRRETVSADAVLRAALDVVAPMAQGRGVALESEVEAGITLVGDADRLQQVAWNLLSNAVKFTPSGGRVRVQLAREGSDVVLRVADTGVGVAPDLLPFVFDRFRQADSSPSRRHGGLGLGLAIARHLVELHGGTIAAESAGEGQGATFTVRLPVRAVQPPAEAPSTGRRAGGPASPRPPSLDGVRVLVCEDEPDARDLLQAVLAGAGAEVRAAASVAGALAALATFHADVLVSDIGMPDEDGYAFIRAVRERAPERGGATPAIALTAYARAADRERALDAGFQVHLAKPIRQDELIRAVAALAGRT